MKPKILVAVDGSETSVRAVEYVGEIVRGCEGIDITLYYVLEIPPVFLEYGGTEASWKEMQKGRETWEKEKRGKIEAEIFTPAKQILKGKGIREDVVKIQTKLAEDAHADVALAILQEVKEGGYGTVVLGKRGISMLKEFMFGSVASKVVHHIEGCTIWIVE